MMQPFAGKLQLMVEEVGGSAVFQPARIAGGGLRDVTISPAAGL